MRRFGFLLIVLLVLGLFLFTLLFIFSNAQPVAVDLVLVEQPFHLGLGVLLVSTLACGLILGSVLLKLAGWTKTLRSSSRSS